MNLRNFVETKVPHSDIRNGNKTFFSYLKGSTVRSIRKELEEINMGVAIREGEEREEVREGCTKNQVEKYGILP